MPAGSEKLRSPVQCSTFRLENDVIFFLCAQSTLSIHWVKILCSIHYIPANFKIFVLVFQFPQMGWEGGWILSSVVKAVCVTIVTFLKSVASKPCVCFYLLIFIFHCCSVNYMIHSAIIRYQWTGTSVAITTRFWGCLSVLGLIFLQ